ncbi:MAG: hypothetical protein ACRENZ_06400 [Thermodesulfobacteriota bacterium]
MTDLWPADLIIREYRTPLKILREQASLLSEKTGNVLIAKVDSEVDATSDSNKLFKTRFGIKAPLLGSYSFALFISYHGIESYPITISPDSEIGNEVFGGSSSIEVVDERQLMDVLRQIFNSNRAKKIINALVAQSA